MITKYQKILLIVTVLLSAIAIAAYLWPQSSEQPSLEPAEPTKLVTPSVIDIEPPAQALPKPVDNKPSPLRFAPKDAQTLAFEFNMQSDAQIDFSFITPAMGGMGGQMAAIPKQSEKTPVLMRASGELYLKYYQDEPNKWRVAARLAETNYYLNGKSPTYAKAVIYPFAFRMTDTGFISDFRFTQGIPSEAQQLLQQLMYTVQTTFPEQVKSTWKTKELDMTGRYRAEYHITKEGADDTIELTKQKHEYFSIQAAKHEINPAISRSKVDIQESLNTIIVPSQGAWLLSLESNEVSVSSSDGHIWAENKNQLSLQRIQRDLSKTFPATFTEFLAQLKDSQYLKSKYYLTDAELDKIGANLDMDGALNLFDSLKNRDISNASREAEKFLVNYLRQHPQATFELVDLMNGDPKRERFDQSTHLVLWRLITEAGHSEAQQALIGALMDSGRSTVTKMRALAYMNSFEYPDTETVQALWDFYQGLGTPSEKMEKEFKTMSLYALGSMGNTDKLNDSVKPTIAQMLTDNLKTVTEPRDQAVALGAVSNYGNEDMIDEITPYFTVEHEGVRAAAYDSLRRMEGSRAVDTLTTYYEHEESPMVRATAAKTLSKMPPSDSGVAWAGQTVLSSDAPKEQIPLVELLGKTLETYPDNATPLRELLKKNPDNKVKREVYKYIVPDSP